MNTKQRAITLIELLTVIAIIAILFGIIATAYLRSQTAAKKGVCISQLRSIGQALELYIGDNNSQFPDLIHRNYPVVLPYANKQIFGCPMDQPPYVNQTTFSPTVLPTSYFPIQTFFDGFYEALVEADDNYTTFVCLLHGARQPVIRGVLNDTNGTVLRLHRDTSVTANQVNTRCHTDDSGGRYMGRNWWYIFSDSKPPLAVLEEVVGTKNPREVPCN
jgi:prepilin-type N-terminal cleavage/methylation domain-containing protein